MDLEPNIQNQEYFESSLIQDIALTQESLNLLRDKLIQVGLKQINNITVNQPQPIDVEAGQVEKINENTLNDFDQFSDLEIDGFVDNILKTSEQKLDRTVSIKNQQTKSTAAVKRQPLELTNIFLKSQQSQNKTNKTPVLFNNSLIPSLQTQQKTDPNKSQNDFNKLIAQTMHKPQGKKTGPPPIIEIASDDQKQASLKANDKSQISLVNSQEMIRLQKEDSKMSKNSTQDKQILFYNKSKNSSQKKYPSNPRNFQKTQYGTYINLPVHQQRKENSNKKLLFDEKLILEIKDKLIKNTGKISSQSIEKLKEKLKTNCKTQERNKQANNKKICNNLYLMNQKIVSDEQMKLKEDRSNKYLRDFMPKNFEPKQPAMREVGFQVLIQLEHFEKDQSKKKNINQNISQFGGPKSSIQMTQKMLTQNTYRNQLPKTATDTPEGIKRSMAKVYNLVKNSTYSEFITRRTLDKSGLIDLGVLSLQEVVEQCHSNKIISDEIYTQFLAHHSQDKILQFLDYFTDNKLQNWDYNQLKITIMDHRRLSQLLVRIYPQKYKICTPIALNQKIKMFLRNLYDLQSQLYKQMLQTFDYKSKIHLWTRLSLKYKSLEHTPVIIQQSTYFQKQNKQKIIYSDKGINVGMFQKNEGLNGHFKKINT